MQVNAPSSLVHPEDAPYQPTDIFSRMGEVELLAELRRIVALARGRADQHTAARAGALFNSFYEHRTQARVPQWLFESARTFVRLHAP